MAIKPYEVSVGSLDQFEKVSFFIQNRFHFRGRRAINRGPPSSTHRRYMYRCTEKCLGSDVISYTDGVLTALTRTEHSGDLKCPVLMQIALDRASWSRVTGYRIDTDTCPEFPGYFRTKMKTKEDTLSWVSDYRRATGFTMRVNDARDRKFGLYIIGKCLKDCPVTMSATLNPYCDFTYVRVTGEHNHGGQNYNCSPEIYDEINNLLETNPNPPRVYENFVYNRRFQCNSIEDLLRRDLIPTDLVVKHLGKKMKERYKDNSESLRVKIPGVATQTEAQSTTGAHVDGSKGVFVYVKGEHERGVVVDLCNRICDMLNEMPAKNLVKLSKVLFNEDEEVAPSANMRFGMWNLPVNKAPFTGFPTDPNFLASAATDSPARAHAGSGTTFLMSPMLMGAAGDLKRPILTAMSSNNNNSPIKRSRITAVRSMLGSTQHATMSPTSTGTGGVKLLVIPTANHLANNNNNNNCATPKIMFAAKEAVADSAKQPIEQETCTDQLIAAETSEQSAANSVVMMMTTRRRQTAVAKSK